ncbi:YdcF family protein [Clostridium gasigenes]|uniref:YdcF family protein n=1 Tax=Clostridium gasigenes TaxID=94869 RepID=UPI001C0C5AA8|nr:YdcF family protein [Clostridium gasigenes]MBU3107906.1 YdcF family protein [Clostridium gasigenes]
MEGVIITITTIVTLIIFLVSFLIDKRRLINGFLFNTFLTSLFMTITYFAFKTQNPVLIGFVLIIVIVLGIVLLFAIYALIVGLLINAKIVIKKEGRSIPNLLTLFLAIGLIGIVIWSAIRPERFFSGEANAILSCVYLIWVYYCIDIFNFLVASLIYQFNKPKLNQDFVIVLGCGLNKDKVTPLLASRIDKSIEFYKKQAQVTTPPKIIFSGGKGNDEEISEALAMCRYAISNGVPEEDCIMEDKSVNTLENMRFSKAIMEKIKGSSIYNSIFVTNNFHLFRAGIYAREAELKSQGIGSKTAKFFIPNALIREYIAIAVMYKKRHLIVVSIMLAIGIALAFVEHFAIVG